MKRRNNPASISSICWPDMLEERLPPVAGSYLLWFFLARRQAIAVGRLGTLEFKRGWYGYCGSAYGPGGLKARLGHHLRDAARPHWHIDYFKAKASLRLIWLEKNADREHLWSRLLEQLPGFSSPVPVSVPVIAPVSAICSTARPEPDSRPRQPSSLPSAR